jgi:predicted nucleic acid-binding protein
MNSDLTFVDTSVLIYAYDADAGSKHEVARSILLDLWDSRGGALSTQVLQEFYVTATGRLSKPLAKRTAREVVTSYRAWPVHRPDADDIVTASELEERHQLAFWDALLIVSAQRSGARILLSEDLEDSRQIGSLWIGNPFASEQPEPPL